MRFLKKLFVGRNGLMTFMKTTAVVMTLVIIATAGGIGIFVATSVAKTGPTRKTINAPVLTLTGETVSWLPVKNASGYIVTQDGAAVQHGAATSYKVPMCNTEDIGISVEAVSAKPKTHDNSISNTLNLRRLPIFTAVSVENITIESAEHECDCELEPGQECIGDCEPLDFFGDPEEIEYLAWPALAGVSAYIVTYTKEINEDLVTETKIFTNADADPETGLIMLKLELSMTYVNIQAKTESVNTLPGDTGNIIERLFGEQLETPDVTLNFVKATWKAIEKAGYYTVYHNDEFVCKVAEANKITGLFEYVQETKLPEDVELTVTAHGLRKINTSELSEPLTMEAFDEFKFYDWTYNNAKNYGSMEMMSHGNVPAGGLAPAVYARGHKILNFNKEGVLQEYYAMTSSGGNGGVYGRALATNIREVYYSGMSGVNMRGRGDNVQLVTHTGTLIRDADQRVIPNFSAASNIGKVIDLSSYRDAFDIDTLRYILYNFTQEGVESVTLSFNTALQQFKITANFTVGSGEDKDWGAGVVDNVPDLEFSGNIEATGYEICTIEFYINTDMQFVRFHGTDKYTVNTGIALMPTATTTATTNMFFKYRDENVTLEDHPLRRPNTNFDTTHDASTSWDKDTPTSELINATGFVANSVYRIDLSWINP